MSPAEGVACGECQSCRWSTTSSHPDYREIVPEIMRPEAAEGTAAQSVLVSGGVAANSELRRSFEREAGNAGLQVFFPSRELSTDNAAMIAAAAYPRLLSRLFAGWDLNAEPVLPLE